MRNTPRLADKTRRNAGIVSLSLGVFLMLALSDAHSLIAQIDKLIVDQRLPELPRASGGQMAGVSGGALVVIGGSDYPTSLFEGGQKRWLDSILVLEPGAKAWKPTGKMDHPLGYGAAVSVDDSVVVIG